MKLKTVVPQGSVLCFFRFFCTSEYTPNGIKKSRLVIFHDDTTVISTCNQVNPLASQDSLIVTKEFSCCKRTIIFENYDVISFGAEKP